MGAWKLSDQEPLHRSLGRERAADMGGHRGSPGLPNTMSTSPGILGTEELGISQSFTVILPWPCHPLSSLSLTCWKPRAPLHSHPFARCCLERRNVVDGRRRRTRCNSLSRLGEQVAQSYCTDLFFCEQDWFPFHAIPLLSAARLQDFKLPGRIGCDNLIYNRET